MKTLIAD